jgi:hypothetical protein
MMGRSGRKGSSAAGQERHPKNGREKGFPKDKIRNTFLASGAGDQKCFILDFEGQAATQPSGPQDSGQDN